MKGLGRVYGLRMTAASGIVTKEVSMRAGIELSRCNWLGLGLGLGLVLGLMWRRHLLKDPILVERSDWQ